jgi:glutamate-ammonia-ligase adenylyltransferase
MGKLGAEELNFSSDVDLVFAYPEAGHTPSGIGTDDFFSRLFRKLIKVLGHQTAHGFVFRIDTNLRPFGEGGPLASSFTAMEHYYQTQGREWERYAWIKARPIAGSLGAGRQLLELLKPFVYRRYLDYGMFEALREMKRKIAIEVRRNDMERNIKLGAGGIREVEFFGQIFQLIRGGVAPGLQKRGILDVLDELVKESFIQERVKDELADAYRFLRVVENRLQSDADRQTHDLPGDAPGLARLTEAMGFPDISSFEAELYHHRQRVHHHFSKLLESEETESKRTSEDPDAPPDLIGIWDGSLDEGAALERLDAIGIRPPEDSYRLLRDLHRQSMRPSRSGGGLQRLGRLVPMLIASAARSDHPGAVLRRLIDLVKGIRRRTNYLALLIENPTVIDHLVRLSDASSLIASFVARHPVLLDEFLDPRTLYAPPGREELIEELKKRLAFLSPEELEEQIEEICIFRQGHSLRIAAADVTETLPLMRVSDHLSDLAEIVVAEVLDLAWTHLEARHGVPSTGKGPVATGEGFAVIAFGKLGGLELGYGSDLDLVFLHGASIEDATDGPLPIDAPQFYSRLGQRMIHILTTHTRAGKIYEVDMRLRPSGNSGPLVSNIAAYQTYLSEKAWTWEHQALIRARSVAGDPELCQAFEAVRRQVLAAPRQAGPLREEVAEMRERLRAQKGDTIQGHFDLKQGTGGIVDIEFLVQFLVLKNGHDFPSMLRWPDNVRLLESLVEAELIDHGTAIFLKDAYLTYRSAAHRLSLMEKPAFVEDGQFTDIRHRVAEIYTRFMSP